MSAITMTSVRDSSPQPMRSGAATPAAVEGRRALANHALVLVPEARVQLDIAAAERIA